MSEEQLLAINVWLAGRSYRIRIRAEEEEAVRKAVKLADAKIMEMRNNYAGKDDQDFVAMCLLMYAADSAIETFHSPIVKQELGDLIGKIDLVLKDS
jgi:cell division protein ZapA